MCLQLHYKDSFGSGNIPKVLKPEVHLTDVGKHMEILNPPGFDPLSGSPALKGQTLLLEIPRLLMLKSFPPEVRSQECMLKRAYLVICVLVLKSRDLIEWRTSMQPKYCKGKKKKT